MHFQSLHLLFEVFYNEYFLGVDAVAEHLRAMDKKALGSTKEFKEHASVKEASSRMNAKMMQLQRIWLHREYKFIKNIIG